MNRYGTSAGFALIASLLFLIVLTLLGISSMGSVGLQERMAANLKEKARATEAGESATRGAELFLAQYPPAGVFEEIPVTSGAPQTNQVWTKGGPIGGANDPVSDFTDDATWGASAMTFSAPPFDTTTLIDTGAGGTNLYAAKPQSYTEQYAIQPYTLNPEDLAKGAGIFYYRVTGRGVGGNSTAVSVVQSMYARRFK